MTSRTSGPEDLLDLENRQRTERLAQKMASLKNFSIDIESETREQNRLLDSMDTDFDSTFGFLSGGRNRLNRLLSSGRQNRSMMCYLTIGLTAILLFVYYLISRSLGSNTS